jgi:molecular chaperone Hsp33
MCGRWRTEEFMEDIILPFHSREASVEGHICLTTGLANEACQRHGTSPTASVALARVLSAGTLLGGTIKPRQRVALKFEGTGPLQKIVVEATGSGKVRGYVGNPHVNLPPVEGEPDIISGLGRAGLLTVSKDRSPQAPLKSIVPLTTSEIQGDLHAYLEQSEQIPSMLQIASEATASGYITAAGGLLVQASGEGGQDGLEKLNEYAQELPPLGALIGSGNSLPKILDLIFSGIQYETRGERPLQFYCSCSRERSRFALITLGSEEVEEILDKEGQAVIDCHFCHERYVFDREELEELLRELNKG